MPEHESRNVREKWKDKVAKWGPLALAICRFVQDITDRLLG
ncbi:hypothetical protein [Nocardia pseudovaccinii]|nr:hypothetical protein [Nocardia pseudovaccinii]